MFLFSQKKKKTDRLVGVDIGTANLKVLELYKDKAGKIFLETYGLVELQSDIIRSDSELTKTRIADTLKQLMAKAGVNAKEAASSIPGFSVFSTIINVPRVKDSELAEAVKWEAKKFVPFPIDDMILDFKVLNQNAVKPKANLLKGLNKLLSKKSKPEPASKIQTNNESNSDSPGEPTGSNNGNVESDLLEVFLTAVPKNISQRYLDIFSRAGFSLTNLEPETTALTRAVKFGLDAKQAEGVFSVIDVGSTATEIIIVDKGFPRVSRNIDVGGSAITSAIANSLRVDRLRAEKFKRDFGLEPNRLAGQIPQVVKPVIEQIVEGIYHTFNLYYNTGGGKIERLVLSGGSSLLKGLEKSLADLVNLEVVNCQPWSKIVYHPDFEEQIKTAAPAFFVCLGLALKS